MKNKKLAFLLGALVLVGCSDGVKQVHLNLKYMTANSAPVSSVDRNAQAEVASAANSTSSSLQELAAMKMATQPKDKLARPIDARATGMTALASIDWDGPVKPIVEKLAGVSGYSVRVLGDAPAVPVLVVVNKENATVADILRDVTYQVENKATIKVYPKSRVIELRYLPA